MVEHSGDGSGGDGSGGDGSGGVWSRAGSSSMLLLLVLAAGCSSTPPAQRRDISGPSLPAILISPDVGQARAVTFNGVLWLIKLSGDVTRPCLSVGRATGTRASATNPLGAHAGTICLAEVSDAFGSWMVSDAVDISSQTRVLVAIGGRGVRSASMTFREAHDLRATASPDRVFVALYTDASPIMDITVSDVNGHVDAHLGCQNNLCS